MPNSRKSSLKHRGQWLEDSTYAGLQGIAAKLGTNVTGLMKLLGDGDVRLEHDPSGELVLKIKKHS